MQTKLTYLQEMSGPFYLYVAPHLHPLLAVLQLLPVEVHVAHVEDGGDDLEDHVLLLAGEAQHLHGGQQAVEVLLVHFAVNYTTATLVQVEVLLCGHQAELGLLLLTESSEHLVEDVVVALLRGVRHNPALLKKILGHFGPADQAVLEEDLEVFPKP